MIIRCPHCNKEFNPKRAIVRERKTSYKWYEFSGKQTFCPFCEKRYQTDVTVKGALAFLFVFLLYVVLEAFGYWYIAMLLIGGMFIVINKKPNLILKIEPK
jgi:hypothetical protein